MIQQTIHAMYFPQPFDMLDNPSASASRGVKSIQPLEELSCQQLLPVCTSTWLDRARVYGMLRQSKNPTWHLQHRLAVMQRHAGSTTA